MNIRAKFKLTCVASNHWQHGTTKTAHFQAVCADEVPENQRYHKYTPGGKLEITIDNPAVTDFLEASIGEDFYLDFAKAT